MSHEIVQNPSKPPEILAANHHVSTTQSTEGWDIFRIASAEDEAQQRILYLHGGAFVWHMIDAHWEFIDKMVTETGAEVIVPAYPLAPYPEASERRGNALAVLPKMAELLNFTVGASDIPTILMGDSAGGNIAAATLMINRDKRQRLPDHTILLSPWLDLALPPEDVANISAPGMSVELLRRDAEAWRGVLSIEDPLVSPVNGSLHNMGRIAVFCGTADVVYPGCERFVDKATCSEGTEVQYNFYADEPHNNLVAGTDTGLQARNGLYELITSIGR